MCACPFTSRRRCAKRKSKALPCLSLFLIFSDQINAVHCIESATRCGMESHLGEYGIDAEHCMESRPKGNGEYSLSADAIRGRAAIPSNSLCELMPYQALRSWINKKTNRSQSRPWRVYHQNRVLYITNTTCCISSSRR